MEVYFLVVTDTAIFIYVHLLYVTCTHSQVAKTTRVSIGTSPLIDLVTKRYLEFLEFAEKKIQKVTGNLCLKSKLININLLFFFLLAVRKSGQLIT